MFYTETVGQGGLPGLMSRVAEVKMSVKRMMNSTTKSAWLECVCGVWTASRDLELPGGRWSLAIRTTVPEKDTTHRWPSVFLLH